MSSIISVVTNIDNIDNLNIVNFEFYGMQLSMMSLDLNENIKVGAKVKLGVNPTHIAIAKDFSGVVSYSNQLKSTIKSIQNGKLLSSIKLSINDEVEIESIITVNSSIKMDLKIGDEVTAFIKASELSILEVIDD